MHNQAFIRSATAPGSTLLFDILAEFATDAEFTACFGVPRAALLLEMQVSCFRPQQ
jgi:hypothetical protein